MNKIPFNQTGLTTTPLALGLAALGRPGYINLGHAADLNQDYAVAAMQQHAHAVLDAAWESGIRHFDAARSYGRAETFLASWIARRAIAADQLLVSSKWGYTYTADWQVTVAEGEKHEVKEHSLEVLERQIGESWQRLGNYIKIYQIHSATLETGVLSNKKVLQRLMQLKQEGVVIGLSTSGPQQADTVWQALKVEVDGEPLFASVQATWNLLEKSVEPALRAAHAAGWGVIIKEALANGRLTSRNTQEQRLLGQLSDVSSELGTTVDALALSAVINQPWTDVVLSGAAQVDHLRSNVQALHVAWSDAIGERLAALREPSQRYWQTRDKLAWN